MSQIQEAVPGIDTLPAKRVVILKGDIDSEDQKEALAVLQTLGMVLTEHATLSMLYSKSKRTSRSWGATAIVGFSARFFKGPLAQERDAHSYATRFSITAPVPPGLRRMDARSDDRFPELATDEQIRDKESDLILVCESDDLDKLRDIATRVQALSDTHKLHFKTVHWGTRSSDGCDHLGFKDGISNLQDLRQHHPEAYRRYVYVQDKEAGSALYDGGTYLVFRKYIEHLDRWFAHDFSRTDKLGHCHLGVKARERAIGRSLQNNLVIDREVGENLFPEFDEAQVMHAFEESHIRQANPRGRGKTNFGAPIIVKDARILRRGFPFTDICSETGNVTYGLLFMCFQSDIQKRGFEFIHNEWLMSEFMGSRDLLLDPDSGIIEPSDGCYYFVPPVHGFPGDVFFITSRS